MIIRRLVLLVLLGTPVVVMAQGWFDGWRVFGSNTARATLYDVSGAATGSPYAFTGDMYYNELSLYLNRQDSEFASWRGELTGLANVNDDYRSANTGLVPERLNLTRENGESTLPYRAELGDYFAYYSFLSLQRSLKGLQLELQPFASNRTQHSFIATTGVNQSGWRGLVPSDDYINGLSWLMQDRVFGSWSINYAHNFRDDNVSRGLLERNQHVISLAGEVPFRLGSQQLVAEGEIAHFNGDHNGLAGPASGQDRADNGYLLELRGHDHSRPFDYRFRFEHYGQDFVPQGGLVTRDRRSYELHAGWRFGAGMRLRLRGQLFEDAYETTNPLRTRTYGINITGPLLTRWYPGLNARLDAFVQNRDNALITISQLSQTMNLNLSAPLSTGWSANVNLFMQNNNNRLGSAGDNLARQLTIGASRAFNLLDWQGYLNPGLTIRTSRKGFNNSDDITPALGLSLYRNAHSLMLNYGSTLQDRGTGLNSIDVNTHTFNLDYRFRYNNHSIGLETGLFRRNPQPGDSTSAYRISFYWGYDLGGPAPIMVARSIVPTGVQPLAADAGLRINLAGLGPGVVMQDISSSLQTHEIGQALEQSGYLVYETDIIRDIFMRQRLALEFAGGLLLRSVVVIDFEDVGDRDSNAQTFERIRQVMIRQLGSPARTFDEGEFSENLALDVNSQRFVRITEWNTSYGVIRFGIPRRLDGQVRMEIQHATGFPSMTDTLWSVDAVR
jgi:hypothetical protein